MIDFTRDEVGRPLYPSRSMKFEDEAEKCAQGLKSFDIKKFQKALKKHLAKAKEEKSDE